MKYTYDDLDVERIRKRKRELKRRQERIRKLKIYSLLLVCAVIAIIIIGVSVGGDDDEGDSQTNTKPSSDFVGTNATEGVQGDGSFPDEDDIDEEGTDEDSTDEENSTQDTIPAEKYANYGDDLYNDGQFIVCIDPGHGSNDVGCIGIDGSYEKDDALKLAKLLKHQLETMGITVVEHKLIA